jgi:uncharacterized membrane protein YciS (DUF1049 family)
MPKTAIESTASNNSSIVVYVFIAVGTYLLSHCLAMLGHTHTQQGALISFLLFFKIKKVG